DERQSADAERQQRDDQRARGRPPQHRSIEPPERRKQHADEEGLDATVERRAVGQRERPIRPQETDRERRRPAGCRDPAVRDGTVAAPTAWTGSGCWASSPA